MPEPDYEEGLETLEETECRALLGDRGVGRVAVTIGAVPAVFPVNYSVLDGEVVFRTGSGTKLDAAVRRAVIAFEIDEVDPLYHQGWSVMVVGVADVVVDADRLSRAEHLPLRPWARGARQHLVAIRSGIVTGRRIVAWPAD
jgi:nitroimidazol reductase NimA-like FMN-containing flavoprotein (pyridoxamine 5'-phosphate oxidase superfamily)